MLRQYFVDATLAVTQKIVCNAIMSESKKYEIAVKVHTTYLPEQSDEALDRYVFAYTIVLANTGTVRGATHQPPLDYCGRDGGVQEVRDWEW